jgi:hypothetical protein
MCLNCHGQPGTDISAETQKALAELYPNDLAIGHKIGDLRGMWSIRIVISTRGRYLEGKDVFI